MTEGFAAGPCLSSVFPIIFSSSRPDPGGLILITTEAGIGIHSGDVVHGFVDTSGSQWNSRRAMVHELAQSADQRGSARARVANRPNGSGDDSNQTRRN